MDWLLPISKNNKVTSIVDRLLVATTSYFIWQEMYNRTHGKNARKPKDVSNIIIDSVRLKIFSIQFKKKA